MPIELTPDGLLIETLEEIRQDMAERYRLTFGRSLPIGDKDSIGFVFGILSERLRLIQEAVQDVYSSQDPNAATGYSLVVVSLLTGTLKAISEPSSVVETMCGDDGFSVPSGSIVSVESTGERFETIGDCPLSLLSDWAASTSYAKFDRVKNGGECYECITGGLSDSSGGPGTQDPDITDNTVHWTWIGTGAAAGDIMMTSLNKGAIIAVARDLNQIETPVGGWNTALNLKDADEGRGEMTDEELRLLRAAELRGQSRSPADGITAALLKLDGVDNATVFMNLTDVVNGDGMPPHSVEALVQGGADQDIWDSLWANVAAGIPTTGTEVGTVVDSQGTSQTIKFTRPDDVPIAVDITIIVDSNKFPLDGEAQVKQAIVDFGNSGTTGKDAVSSSLGAQAFSVTGVLDVVATLIAIDPATPTLSTTIAISLRELATYATSRVTVHSSTGVP